MSKPIDSTNWTRGSIEGVVIDTDGDSWRFKDGRCEIKKFGYSLWVRCDRIDRWTEAAAQAITRLWPMLDKPDASGVAAPKSKSPENKMDDIALWKKTDTHGVVADPDGDEWQLLDSELHCRMTACTWFKWSDLNYKPAQTAIKAIDTYFPATAVADTGGWTKSETPGVVIDPSGDEWRQLHGELQIRAVSCGRRLWSTGFDAQELRAQSAMKAIDTFWLPIELVSSACASQSESAPNASPAEEPSKPSTPEGRKDDQTKNRLDLLPFEALEIVGQVLTYGCAKYGAHNWRKGMAWHRLFGAALRHLWAWFRGEKADPETGLSHLAHAACCILFLLTYELYGLGEDDRPKMAA